MIISFRCPPKVKERVDAVIATGLYPDFSTFCVTALENQLLLEESAADKPNSSPNYSHDSGIRPSQESGPQSRRVSKRTKSKRNLEPVASRAIFTSPDNLKTRSETLQNSNFSAASLKFPELDLSRLSGDPPFSLPSAFADIFQPDQEIPVDRWLFGQYNRLLPAKLSVRALGVISEEGKDAFLLETVAPRIAETAARFGTYLASLDQRFGSHRDDTLATAFPEENAQGQKGKVRYQNHFVGHTLKGEQGGLLVGLKLAVIKVVRNKPHIFLTTAGWDFARLPNPLLDAPATDPPDKFSTEEVSFLLSHIKGNVPVERFAYTVMLSLIVGGSQTPESVSVALARRLSTGKRFEDERDFIATQRTGVLGRMCDLQLVTRQRHGTHITYQVSPRGRRLLDEVGSIPATTQFSGGF